MKKAFVLFQFAIISLFGEMIILDNQSSYLDKKPNVMMKLQWAASSQDMEEKTIDCLYHAVAQKDLMLLKGGENQILFPGQPKYFRILVWTEESPNPTYVSSWVQIVADKTYTLQDKDLFHSVLMAGSGC